MRSAVRSKATFFAHVVPGLEELAVTEMRRLPGLEVTRVLRKFDERTSIILFRYEGPAKDMLSLRMLEDVFALAAESNGMSPQRRALGTIRSLMVREPPVERAATLAMGLRPPKGRVTYRVIARTAGKHAFRRVDVQRAVEIGLQERFPRWRLVEDDAKLEVWAQLVGDYFLAGARLSDISMRQRTYRKISLPAALKPTIAHAMVDLSQPRAEDIFLDPMCGSGTILLERAQAARYGLLLGGDSNPEAVRATRENVGTSYKPIEIERWDARNLPLSNASVSVIVCNLPFGKQIGTPEEIKRLYPQLLGEWLRVLEPHGRMVLLSSERSVLERTLRSHRELRIERQVPVLVRGLSSTIVVVRGTKSGK